MGIVRDVKNSNYYLSSVFGEAKLTKASLFIGGALILGMFVVISYDKNCICLAYLIGGRVFRRIAFGVRPDPNGEDAKPQRPAPFAAVL